MQKSWLLANFFCFCGFLYTIFERKRNLKPKKTTYFKGRILSGVYACKGVLILLKKERNIQVQFVIAILVTAMGFYYHITPAEWSLQLLSIGLVIGLEAFNTALEEMADFIQPTYHEHIKKIKDIAAAAVLFAAIVAFVVGVLIYYPYLFT